MLSRTIDRVFLKHHTIATVTPWLLLFLGFSFFKSIMVWMEHIFANRGASQVKQHLREQLGHHLRQLGPAYLKGERTGELTNTLLTGVDALDAYFSQFLPQLFLSALIPLTILLVVFPRDILSGIVLLLTAPLIPIFMRLIGAITEKLNQRQWKTLSRLSAHFLDILQGLTTLKLFNRSREQIRVISRISNDFRLATMKVLKVAFLSALVLEMVATISTAVVAVAVGLRLLYGKMPFEQALFILILAPEFYLPFRLLGARYHAGMESMAAAERILDILEIPAPPVTVTRAGILPSPASTPIRFQSVTFSYRETGSPALQQIDLVITPGQKIAVVGPSGAGKSTIIALLLRFLQPDSGRILLGSTDVLSIDPEQWRKQIAWVPQQPYLFHCSITDNIHMGTENVEEEDIIKAAKEAHLHEFITSLPDGYNTLVGEHGARLSGGQAQRIALARAFLKDAPLLILDEATANLDPNTEAQIQDALQRLMAERTVVMIAHRLHTVQQADVIYVMSGGSIVQQGNHRSLLAEDGLYRRLIQTYGGS